MNWNLKISFLIFLSIVIGACSQYNKGVTNKNEFRPSNPPSVRIQKEYAKEAKKASRGKKSLKGKDGKKLEKAKDRLKRKKLRKDKRYLRRKRRKIKK